MVNADARGAPDAQSDDAKSCDDRQLPGHSPPAAAGFQLHNPEPAHPAGARRRDF